MDFICFLGVWKLSKAWSASGGRVVVLSTSRIKDTLIVWCVLTSDYFSSAASPLLEVDTMVK